MKKYVNLEMPSILGMGAVGPTLSVLTATLCAAFSPLLGGVSAAYPLIMLFLSALLAVFPTVKAEYPKALKAALYPIVTIVIFASAWGVNTGLSVGEEALSAKPQAKTSGLSLVGSAYAGDSTPVDTNIVNTATLTNKVSLADLDFDTKAGLNQNLFTNLSKEVWSLSWTHSEIVYLKDGDGKWWSYNYRKKEDLKQQKGMKGGFFKRY